MNQKKIGKFISTCRKNKNLTQEQLAETNLIELKSKLEEQTKKLLNLEIIIGLISCIPFLVLILLVAYFEMTPTLGIILIIIAIILFIVGIFTGMKIEREVGYYECKEYHHKYIPNNLPFWLSMRYGRTRYLKCHKYSWNKKVLTK